MLVARDLWLTPPGAPEAVVRGLSFEAGPGDWIAITGPNGCGKSTLALAAAGLLRPDAGTITWHARPVFEPAARAGARPVLAILQDPSTQLLQPTLAEELRFTAANLGRSPGEIESEVARVTAALGLDEDPRRDPATLSAGRQQLALIAAALIARPALLVADEPCAHLDPRARGRVLDLIAAEVSRGMAVLWVTQNDEEAARAGRTITFGDPPSCHVTAEPLPEGVAGWEVAVAPDPGGSGPRIRTAAVQLIIPSPGLLALEGPNGCGKTVFLAALAGIAPCRQVRVTNLRRADPAPLMVGQYPELLVFQERAADELVYSAVRRGVPAASAHEQGSNLLRHWRLDPESLLRKSVWDLSTGEKRLLEIAAALIAPASLLVLDEPTGGLDTSRKDALAIELRRRATRSAVVVASQDRGWLDRLGAPVWTPGGAVPAPSAGKKSD